MPQLAASRFLLALGFFACGSAQAALGVYEHGAGIKSLGFGGVAYSLADETTALSANPAHALSLGRRYDVGIDVMLLHPNARIDGNAAAPDDRYASDGRRFYGLPQAGIAFPLSDRWAMGVSILEAGLGPDYSRSPYERFGGARRAGLSFGSVGIATSLAYQLTQAHAVGVGLNVGYQILNIEGLQFLTSTDPAFRVSETPDKVSNQGKDDAFSLGFSLGWIGQITPKMSVGAGYRSKGWTQKQSGYKGLLPDQGSLELPAIYGAGIAYKPAQAWTLAFDWQHYAYESEKGFSNPFSRLSEGKLLGSADGPGFGIDNQDAYKFGIAFKASPKLTLRAGYVRANQNVSPSETLFDLLGPVTMTTHYSAGATYDLKAWEISGFFAEATKQTVRGENSIPPALGGGEASVSNEAYSLGFSLGRKF